MTAYRINGQGNIMGYSFGMWTVLPPKRAKQVLFSMERAALIGLISIMAVILLPSLSVVAYG